MKSNQKQGSQISKLRKSASLILLYPQQQSTSSKQHITYKTLILKRKSTMSFSNVYVFPGGTVDNKDKQISKQHKFQQYSKITAMRQFLQQAGLLVYPITSRKIVQNQQFINMSQEQIGNKLGDIWGKQFELIEPVLRLMTPQIQKGKRFDCIFHICRINQNIKVINIPYLKNILKQQTNNNKIQQLILKSSKLTQNKLIFNKYQSDAQIIDTPSNILHLFFTNKIHLAPPQIIIMKCLTNLCQNKNRQQLMKFGIHKKQKSIRNIQPIMFQFDIPNRKLYILGDKSYDYKKIIKKQPESQSKSDLQKHFQQKIKNSNFKVNGKRVISIADNINLQSNYNEQDNKLLFKFLNNDPINSKL